MAKQQNIFYNSFMARKQKKISVHVHQHNIHVYVYENKNDVYTRFA